MIAANIQNAQIRRRRAQAQQQVHQAARNAQSTLNAILWQLITENTKLALDKAELAGEDVPVGPAMLTLPIAALKEIPANFGLTLKQNPEDGTISVIAVLVKPKSNIILPGDG